MLFFDYFLNPEKNQKEKLEFYLPTQTAIYVK